MARKKASKVALHRLLGAIGAVASRPEECAKSPGDLARGRKLPLPLLLWTMVTWGEDTLKVELADATSWDGSAPTASAFCQQRAKLRGDVMERLHAEFLSAWPNVPFEGRHGLVAADGTGARLVPSKDPRCRIADYLHQT